MAHGDAAGPGPQQSRVYYTQPASVLAAFLPNRVTCRRFTRGRLLNGDFAVPAADVQAGRLRRHSDVVLVRSPRRAPSV